MTLDVGFLGCWVHALVLEVDHAVTYLLDISIREILSGSVRNCSSVRLPLEHVSL